MRYILLLLIIIQIRAAGQSGSPKREFRGTWIATVENIDWPSKKYLSSDNQKLELISILDRLKKDKINAVFIQIRPSCDAFYKSELEPWSEWLTGKQGKEPEPYYDPLNFIVKECHKRGIEIHAWLNPFRSVVNINTSDISKKHISKTHPDWVIEYGKYKWLNPGIPSVRDYVTNVVVDVVKRYNIDGIHFDDYFYPYPVKNKKFRDERTFEKYSRGIKILDEWRRDNINIFVKQISDSINKVNPGCIFGISPFGIWKNSSNDKFGSDTKGSESYYKTYSDSKKWIENGWIDYLVPQLYWDIGNPIADYKILAEWWNNNSYKVNMYIGQAVYKITDNNDILNQIRLNRSLKNISGNVFFNTNTFMKDPLGLEDSLKDDYYKNYAITPVIKSHSRNSPQAPINGSFSMSGGRTTIRWENTAIRNSQDTAEYFVIYKFPMLDTIDISRPDRVVDIVYGTESSWDDTSGEDNKTGFNYVVTSLDNYKNESSDQCRILVSTSKVIESNIIYTNPNSLDVIRQNSILKIIIRLDKLSLVTLIVYDLNGKEIKQIMHEYHEAGQYEIEFEENIVKSKGYIVQLKTKGYYLSQRVYIQ